MPEILVLCPGRESRRIVDDQLRPLCAEVVHLNTRSELSIFAMERGVKAVVSDLFDGEGRPMTSVLRELNREVPELKIVLSYDPSPAALDDVLDLATSGLRVAFAARPLNDIGRLLDPLLLSRSTRPPSPAESLLLRVIPRVDSVGARRCLTLASVNPVPQLGIAEVARFCDTNERTLYRHLTGFGPPKLLLSALAWPQANYFLTGLRWSPRQVAAYCGLRRPGLLIDLLGAYVDSGLWALGLDPGVDEVAAATAKREAGKVEPFVGDASEGAWKSLRLQQMSDKIVRLARSGMSPLAIVRQLWFRCDLDPGLLYRGVMQAVDTVQAQGHREKANR